VTLVVGTDSYVTLAEADALLFPHPRRSTWKCRSDVVRELALLQAARTIDQQRFVGQIADQDQALAWPRAGVCDAEGRVIDSATVPDAVKLAQAELALHLVADDFEGDEVPENVRRVRAGTVEVEFGTPPGAELPKVVADILRPFLQGDHSLRLVP